MIKQGLQAARCFSGSAARGGIEQATIADAVLCGLVSGIRRNLLSNEMLWVSGIWRWGVGYA
jgi:hypothetical protein